ncbi:MAG: rhodanese-like domain-containing protein [Atopobiaceae bacterium]|jgi:phage shock protein E
MSLLSIFGAPQGAELLQKARAEEGARIVDVREPDEFATGHIKGAINIPLSRYREFEQMLPHKDATLYLYCASGARSSRACKFLSKMGYSSVCNMGGVGTLGEDLVC